MPQPSIPSRCGPHCATAADFLAAGDFDADGHADLVAASAAKAALELHRGNGRGGFGAAESRALPAPPTALGAFDLDLADGLPELVAAVDDGQSRQLWRLGGARGAWPAAARGLALETRVEQLAAGLFDQDAFYDLAVGDAAGWRQLARRPRRRPFPAAAARSVAAAGRRPARRDLAAALELRLDDNAAPDFATLDAAGRVGFEIHGMLATFTVNTTDDTVRRHLQRRPLQPARGDPGRQRQPRPRLHRFRASPARRPTASSPLPSCLRSTSPPPSTAARSPASPARPIVEVHGGSTWSSRGLWLAYSAAGSTVRSLVVNGFVVGGAAGLMPPPSWSMHRTPWSRAASSAPTVAGTAVVANSDGIYLGLNADRGRVGGTAPGAGNLASGQLGYGIAVNAVENRIEGNIVGLDRSGDQILANYYGIVAKAILTVVGGTAPGAGNLVSGQESAGIVVTGSALRVQGNRIGTDAAGESARPNREAGLGSESCADCLVGGTSSAAGNLISGNLGGLSFWNNVTGSSIEGNRIGVSASGAPLGNAGSAIVLNGSRNRVGSADPAGGNVIAHNDVGIRCLGYGARHILGNSIYANNCHQHRMRLPGADPHRRQLEPPPARSSKATFQGAASQAYRIELFSTESCGLAGQPQGRYLLGWQNLTTNGSGQRGFHLRHRDRGAARPGGHRHRQSPAARSPARATRLHGHQLLRLPHGGRPAARSADRPWSIPQHVPAAAFGDVTVPVIFQANGHAIAGLAFSVDLGGCVSFDPADANADHLPDAVALHLPAGWAATVT